MIENAEATNWEWLVDESMLMVINRMVSDYHKHEVIMKSPITPKVHGELIPLTREAMDKIVERLRVNHYTVEHEYGKELRITWPRKGTIH